MNKLLNCLISAFLPARCPYCTNKIPAEKPACYDCEALFPETIRESYAKGGYPCASPFPYDGGFAFAVKRFKFNNRTDFAQRLSERITEAVREAYGDIEFDYVTCVPMHINQLKERGYNQSLLLAKLVSKQLGLPYEDLLEKIRENEPQHSLTSNRKRDNVKGVYSAINIDKIKGNNILIIDDIITTGYTLGECCKTLQKAGANKIRCSTLCAVNFA